MPEPLHKHLDKETKEKHFRFELGLGDPYQRVRKSPGWVYELREEYTTAKPKRKIEISKELFDKGIIGELEYKTTVKRYGKD